MEGRHREKKTKGKISSGRKISREENITTSLARKVSRGVNEGEIYSSVDTKCETSRNNETPAKCQNDKVVAMQEGSATNLGVKYPCSLDQSHLKEKLIHRVRKHNGKSF